MIFKVDLLPYIPPSFLEAAEYVQEIFSKNNFEVFLVGGSVRSLILKKHLSDLDFTTNATPQETMKLFKRVVPLGIPYGTILVLYKKVSMEITTYRMDMKYKDGRRPSEIVFGQSLSEDVKRRDFTMNGLAYNIARKELHDYCEGLEDIKKKLFAPSAIPFSVFRRMVYVPCEHVDSVPYLDLPFIRVH